MRRYVTIIAWLALLPIYAQQITVQGVITDTSGEPAIGANIIIKGTYEGTSSEVDGSYQITAAQTDTLVFSYIGAVDQTYLFDATTPTQLQLDIVLKPVANMLAQATVSGAKNREIVKLTSRRVSQMQVFTTAGDPGNILMAAQGGASASVNPASGKLLARGGRAEETQFYMDGMLQRSPYINTIAGVNTRLRQNPYMVESIEMFNGTASAEYGQALSSIFSMNTKQKLKQNQLSVSASTVGVNANVTRKVGKGGMLYNIDFLDLTLNNQLTVNNINWLQPYRSISNQMLWDVPLGEKNTLKLYANHTAGNMQLNTWVAGQERDVFLDGSQSSFMGSYKHFINAKWDLSAAAIYQRETEQTTLSDLLDEQTTFNGWHGKVVAKHYMDNDITLKIGGEVFQDYHVQEVAFEVNDFKAENKLDATNAVLFGEWEQEVSKKLSYRLGIRVDDLNRSKPDLSLRGLVGYNFTPATSLVASYGTFHQAAPVDYRYFRSDLSNERSEQYILTLAHSHEDRKASVTAFSKQYTHLARAAEQYQFQPETINSEGSGHARGIDIALEDRKSVANGEMFLSYAYLHSRRNDRSYPGLMNPSFLYPHQLTFRGQKFISAISSNVSLTATWFSGKVLDNPWTEAIDRDAVDDFRNLSLSYTYIVRLFKSDITYIHLSLDNILNINNEVGFIYASPTTVLSQKSTTRRSLFFTIISNF